MPHPQVTLRPFPLADADAPLEEEERFIVQARQFSLSELTASTRGEEGLGGAAGGVTRVRVQVRPYLGPHTTPI